MKNIKFSTLFLTSWVLLTVLSCKKDEKTTIPSTFSFDLSHSVTMNFPDTVKKGSPVTLPTPAINTDAAKNFEKNNTKADYVKSASLKQLKMKILTPDTIIDFNVKNSADMSFPTSTNTGTPATIPIPDFLTKFQQEIPNYAIVTKDLNELILKELKFTIPSSDTSDFSFLQTINVYIKGAGLNEELIAGLSNIPLNVGKTLSLDSKNTNLAPHFKASSYALRTEVVFRKLIGKAVSSTMDFSLKAKSWKIQTFSFLNSIELYISGTNLPDKLIASKKNIPSTIGNELILDSENADFAPYIKGTTYGLRSVTTTDELVGTDIKIKLDLTFTLTADPL